VPEDLHLLLKAQPCHFSTVVSLYPCCPRPAETQTLSRNSSYFTDS